MPFISDRELNKLQGWADRSKERGKKLAAKAREKAEKSVHLAEAVGAAGAMGFVRGKFENKTTGEFNIPGTKIDIEMVVGILGVGAALGFEKSLGKWGDDVLAMSGGILAHYTGQLARKFARTGQFTMVAGDGGGLDMFGSNGGVDAAQLSVGSNWDPTSFHPTQISAPFDDPVAMALAQSGV